MVAKMLLRLLGCLLLAFAAFGAWASWITIKSILDAAADTFSSYYALVAFWCMLGSCVFFYAVEAFIAANFIVARTKYAKLFARVMVAIVVYYFTVVTGCMALVFAAPRIGADMFSAVIVASTGLVPQLYSLFPLWGSWAGFRLVMELEPDSVSIRSSEEFLRTGSLGAGIVVCFVMCGVLIRLVDHLPVLASSPYKPYIKAACFLLALCFGIFSAKRMKRYYQDCCFNKPCGEGSQ